MGEDLTSCQKCMKYLLFVLNIVFFLCGVAMLGTGIWILVDYPSFTTVLDHPLIKSGVYLLIGIGGVVAIISFLGCFGAVKENKCLLVLYALILLLMVIGEIAAAGCIFYFGYSDVEQTLLKAANDTFVKYGEDDAITQSWDTIQDLGECCGILGVDDFQYTKFTGESIPDSCCVRENLLSTDDYSYSNLTACHMEIDGYYNNVGCLDKLKSFVTGNVAIAAGIAIGIAFIQLIGIVGGCILCRAA